MNERISLGRGKAVSTLVLAATFGALTACAGTDEEAVGRSVEATTTTPVVVGGSIQVDLPDGFSLESTAVAANGQLNINDRATIYAAVSGLGTAVNVGTGLTDVGADARVGDVLGGGNVNLRDRAQVSRNVQAGGALTRSSGVVVSGTSSARAPLKPNVNRSWLVGFSDTAANITLNSGQNQTPAAGSFGTVTVNAGGKLTLKAGTYNINSLKLEPQSSLTFDTSNGPVIVNVKNELVFRGTVQNRAAVASKVLFAYLGTTMVSLDAPFAGTLLAPTATVKVESLNGATHYGAFFGQNVEVHQGGNVQHSPFANWSSLPFVNDGADAVAAVGASATLARSGTDGLLTYAPSSPLMVDFSSLTVRKVSTLPSTAVLDFGNNFKCAQRPGFAGLDCTDFSPLAAKPINTIFLRKPFSSALISALVGDLRAILRCTTDLCPTSAGGLFRASWAYPKVKRQLKWQTEGVGYDTSSDAIKSAYADWSDDPSVIPNKRDFLLALNDAAAWLRSSDRFSNFRGQPETALTATGDGAENEANDTATARYYISYQDAWRLYVWWVAHNVALDWRRELPWTLDDIAADDESNLAPLFDSTEMMHRRPTGDVGLGFGPHGNYLELPWSVYHGSNIIGTPRFTFRFLSQGGMIANNRLNSIESLLDWSHNLTHFYGSDTRENAQAHWGHRYFPTVEKIINGTIRTGESTPKHWTAGCHGTAFFLKDVLRAINIPVRVPFICQHAEVQFVSEGKFMDHADDPYNSTYTNSQCSAEHLLLDASTFLERFGRSVNHDDPETCGLDPVARQVREESVALCE